MTDHAAFERPAAKSASANEAALVMARLEALAAYSDEPDRLTRLYLTPAHKAAASRVRDWMAEAGMEATIDAAGTVVGRMSGARDDAPTLILGSHIDTVRNAGRYDGALGVVLSIAAVGRLAREGRRLPFAIEVVAFGDEEGVRFPEALSTARALAGTYDPAVLALADAKGTTLGAALAAFGGDAAAIPALSRRGTGVFGYLEVHIEQGPVLEAENLPVGVVTAIAGATRLRASVTGMAGHAGTVPMRLRRDAFAAAAEMAVEVERIAAADPDLVATVGQFAVVPGAVNVIPSSARFTIDLRSPDDRVRRAALALLEERITAIAARRGVELATEVFYDEAARPCAPGFREALGRAITRQGLRVVELPSGAGHDGVAMAALCPIGMVFVRCAGGISHNPAESVTTEDVAIALDVLVDTVCSLAP